MNWGLAEDGGGHVEREMMNPPTHPYKQTPGEKMVHRIDAEAQEMTEGTETFVFALNR